MANPVTIVPTILTSEPADFSRFLTTYSSFAKRIQFDIADGSFVSTTTVPLSAITQIPANISIDIHMMVLHPSEHMQDILRIKPSLCIFHAEADENLLPILAELKKNGIKAGVALLQQTFPGRAKAYIEAADHVLVFAGALGKQGGTADLLQTEKVKLIKEINSEAEIGWDGGVNLENVRALGHADINVINVGSFIAMNQNPEEAYKSLVEEVDKRGIAL